MNQNLTRDDDPTNEQPAWLAAIRARTPAAHPGWPRWCGIPDGDAAYLRHDHAAALDAVHAEFDLERDLGRDLVERHGLFLVQTQAASKAEFLARPDRGRRLSAAAIDLVRARCPADVALQIILGDGLSATALKTQTPALLPLLLDGAAQRGWKIGQPFAVRYCRVGVFNDVGELLDPAVAVLLIGERPGLATAESLSAYLAYRPRASHTDAQRNLISNIHSQGVTILAAAQRIFALAERMISLQTSGVALKEDLANRPRIES